MVHNTLKIMRNILTLFLKIKKILEVFLEVCSN